jgi:HlyD family secretion protein
MRHLLVLCLISLFALNSCASEENSSYSAVVEGTTVQVPVLVGGRLLQLRVETGDAIAAGDTVAVIDTMELHLQMKQLAATKAELTAQLKAAQIQLRQAAATEEHIRQKLQRIEEMVKNNAAPQQSLDDLSLQLKNARFARETARQNIETLQTKAQKLDAQAALLTKKIRDALITAPTSGTVTEVYYEVGEAAAPFSPIAEITQIDEVTVKIYVAEPHLALISPGQKATILVDGLGESLVGEIAWISPRAEFTPKNILTPETRTSLVYAVKINVKNPAKILKHGMPVSVTLH